MTPARMAEIHAMAFETQRPWNADEFKTLRDTDLVFFVSPSDNCFALGRTIAGEAELLTIATAPKFQRTGLAKCCLQSFFSTCRDQNVDDVFLEVDAQNVGAIALYESFEFRASGRRKGYYQHPNGSHSDALLMTMSLRKT